MKKSGSEPSSVFSEENVRERSTLAAAFLDERSRLNGIVTDANNKLLNRIYNVDHNTYLEGALPSRFKELMGLVASASLRCDDCITYHVIQSFRLGCSRQEQEEALNVATVVGGTIVVPHLRRAYALLSELYPVSL